MNWEQKIDIALLKSDLFALYGIVNLERISMQAMKAPDEVRQYIEDKHPEADFL